MTDNITKRIDKSIGDIENIQRLFKEKYGEECIADKEILEVLKIAKSEHEELLRWRTNHINKKIKNPFAWTSTSICHNCDHKDEYIEELEAEVDELKKKIGEKS